MENEELIEIIIKVAISSGILNILLTHFLYTKKLRKELKNIRNNIVSQDIEKSLSFVRNMELELNIQEIYNINEEKDNQINYFDCGAIYLAIFNNWDSFHDFLDKVEECRSKYEKYLTCRIALNLVYIERYILQLNDFLKKYSKESMLPFWGTIFIGDLLRWQKRFDKMLIKEINKHRFKLESHETLKWKILRKFELEKQFENTILYYFINGKYKRKNKKHILALNAIIETILENESNLKED